jgi:hypothetical protein
VSPYPTNRETARRTRKDKYHNDVAGGHCTNCSDYTDRPTYRRYTTTDACVNCCTIDALELYGLAITRSHIARIGEQWFVVGSVVQPVGVPRVDKAYRAINDETLARYIDALDMLGCLDANNTDPDPDTVRAVQRAAINPIEASQWGRQFYVSENPCAKSGHIHVRDAETTMCRYCATDTSPRQAALAAGDRWYTPDTPCKRCGTMAPKMVANGQCSGCTGEQPTDKKDGRSTPDAELMRAQPDMLIERTDARLLGMRVYRTGRACQRGHTGFRYVSTGSCIDCLRG